MNYKKKKSIVGIAIISLFVMTMFSTNLYDSADLSNSKNENQNEIEKLTENFTTINNKIEIEKSALPSVLGESSIYSTRFLELFEDLQTEGYLSSEGIPYHSIETFMVEAPDYGHMTTSESFSFLVWLGAQYGQITGDWSYYKDAWDLTEQYIIPDQGVDQFGVGYNPSTPATYAPEEALPSDYPNTGQASFPTGIDPLADELASTYNSDGVYQMHWLLDVDNWYGYGNHGDGTSRASYMNTYQRGPQESVWETVPHPSWEDFSWGATDGGFLPIFADFGGYAEQWRYTSASDADARNVQASYWALKWAQEQGVEDEIADYTAKASKMGDYLRYTQYDKFFKPIGIQDGTTVGTGEDSNTGLLTWYTSWGGGMNDDWGFRIGASHSHQGYQNVLAAYALANEPELIPISPNGQSSWERSEDRQIELYQYLQSTEGAIAGGVTNSWEGAYQPYPDGSSTFYDMIFDVAPVYHDPPSNEWFGMQAWGMERVIAHYLETNDIRTKEVSDKWVDWAISQVKLYTNGSFAIPGTLEWTGQPDTWTGTSTGNPDLHATVANWGQDIGITACLAKALIQYAAATEKWEGTADNDAYITGKELLDRMWTLYRDDQGVAVPETRGDYSRLDDEVYVPSDYTGINGQGATVESGITFLEMRPEYLNDPSYDSIRDSLDAGEDPTMTYHRFWAQADVALAMATMHMYFPEEIEDDELPPAIPTGVSVSSTGASSVNLDWNDNVEEDFLYYNIYRSNSPNVAISSTNLISTSSSSSYEDTGLASTTTYYYVITAYDMFDYESSGSSEVSATTTEGPPPPDTPTGLLVVGVTDGTISLDWNDNSETDLSHYTIHRSTVSGFTATSTNQIAQTSVSSYTDTGLSTATTYYYKIIAVNTELVSSSASSQTSGTTLVAFDGGLITNGDFSDGTTAWTTNVYGGSATFAVTDEELVTSISYAGTENWNIQIQQQGFTIENNVEYTVSFLARASGVQEIFVGVGEYLGSYTSYGDQAFTLDTTMQAYSFTFTMAQATDTGARIDFNLGLSSVDIIIDNVAIREDDGSDTIAPTISNPTDIAYIVSTTGHSITWSASDLNPDTYTITRDGSIIDSGSWSSGSPISISIDGLPVGQYSYTITVSDVAGNIASDLVNVVVSTSNIAPVISYTSDVSYIFDTTGHSISWTVTDTNPDTYIIQRGSSIVDSGSWSSGSPISINIDGLSVDTYIYTITVSDDEGMTASDSVNVIVTSELVEGGDVWMGEINGIRIGDTFDTTIFVDTGVQKVASYGIKIYFDPTIIQVSSVAASDNGFYAASNFDNDEGWVFISGFDYNGLGPNDMQDLFDITWNAISIGTTNIIIEIDVLSDEATNTIGIPNGIESNIIVNDAYDYGDVNHDGEADIIDALLVAQFYVGEPVVIDELLADVNLDGSVTIVDALLIAQYYVGEIPSLPYLG